MARNKKHEQDKFYTKPEEAIKLISKVNISEFDLIIEPSAGNGSFYNQIYSDKKIGLDIEPESDLISKMDWFDFTINKPHHKSLVIGNPPFGNQGSLAMKFIKKCDDLSINTIAFILPRSFKKESYKRKIPLMYHLIHEEDLNDDIFTLMGNTYPVPCCFQVWERRDVMRILENNETKSDVLEFVKKDGDPDFAFRRVGFYAGRIYDEYQDKSEQSHYFIKCSDDIKKIISNILWEHNNTSGPRSIGKSELIKRIKTYSI